MKKSHPKRSKITISYSGRRPNNISDSTRIWTDAIRIPASADDLSTLPDEHFNKDQIITWI
jgi:hypothetical protein